MTQGRSVSAPFASQALPQGNAQGRPPVLGPFVTIMRMSSPKKHRAVIGLCVGVDSAARSHTQDTQTCRNGCVPRMRCDGSGSITSCG